MHFCTIGELSAVPLTRFLLQVMQAARAADEKLRASVRQVRAESEEAVMNVRREMEDEAARIRRLAAEKEEKQALKWRAQMEEMNLENDKAYQRLKAELSKSQDVKRRYVDEAQIVSQDLEKVKGEFSTFEDGYKKRFDLVEKVRMELAEERMKANQRTLDKIAMANKDIQYIKNSVVTANDSLSTMREDLVPLTDKMADMTDAFGQTCVSFNADVKVVASNLRKDVVGLDSRVTEDIGLFMTTMTQEMAELRQRIAQQPVNKTQTCYSLIGAKNG